MMNKVKCILKWVLISFGGLMVFLLLLIVGVDWFLGFERGVCWLYSKVDQFLVIKFMFDEVCYL